MKRVLSILILLLVSGCAGTGFDKQVTLVPDSITAGWGQETYHGDPAAWQGFNIYMTWNFKKPEVL